MYLACNTTSSLKFIGVALSLIVSTTISPSSQSSEKDILKFVNTLIANTKGEGKAGDDFWVKAETLLYCALVGYIHYEAPKDEQSLQSTIMI